MDLRHTLLFSGNFGYAGHQSFSECLKYFIFSLFKSLYLDTLSNIVRTAIAGARPELVARSSSMSLTSLLL